MVEINHKSKMGKKLEKELVQLINRITAIQHPAVQLQICVIV